MHIMTSDRGLPGSAWEKWRAAGIDWRAEHPNADQNEVLEAAEIYSYSRGFSGDNAIRTIQKAFKVGVAVAS